MRLLRKLGALSIAFSNIWSWAVILSGVSNYNFETSGFALSVSVIFASYFFGLFKLLGALKPYRVERVIATPIISKATLKLNEEQNIYMTYEVKEDRVSEDDWKAFKIKLEDYAKSFLGKYYPTVVVDFEFRLLDQKLDNNLNGRHTALYSYFGDHDNYIYLSDWLVHASIYCIMPCLNWVKDIVTGKMTLKKSWNELACHQTIIESLWLYTFLGKKKTERR